MIWSWVSGTEGPAITNWEKISSARTLSRFCLFSVGPSIGKGQVFDFWKLEEGLSDFHEVLYFFPLTLFSHSLFSFLMEFRADISREWRPSNTADHPNGEGGFVCCSISYWRCKKIATLIRFFFILLETTWKRKFWSFAQISCVSFSVFQLLLLLCRRLLVVIDRIIWGGKLREKIRCCRQYRSRSHDAQGRLFLGQLHDVAWYRRKMRKRGTGNDR